jgi:hypothetical protein
MVFLIAADCVVSEVETGFFLYFCGKTAPGRSCAQTTLLVLQQMLSWYPAHASHVPKVNTKILPYAALPNTVIRSSDLQSKQPTAHRLSLLPTYLYQMDERALSRNHLSREFSIGFPTRNSLSLATLPHPQFLYH